MVKRRGIILRIDDILALFRDYMPEGDLPEDAQVMKMQINPSTRELALQVISPSFEDERPLKVVFTHRKLYGGGE